MEIVNLSFEKPLKLIISGETVELIAFKTPEPGNIKFGVEAPRKMGVDREEIRNQKKEKSAQAAVAPDEEKPRGILNRLRQNI